MGGEDEQNVTLLCDFMTVIKVNLHVKYQGRRSSRSDVRRQTDRQTNTQTDKTNNITSLANAGGNY